ncbi:MAG: hypothetical protein IT381_18035 [Deltaproteobacteria bacterium]|nr:hypothetical protein [Deltaproteobacteria bacterium]
MAKKRKPPKRTAKAKPRRSTKKARRPAAKAKAKRRSKPLVKAPKVASARGKGPKSASKSAKNTRATAKHPARVKFVKRARDTEHELHVQSLIARVYRKAAEEMRALEEQSVNAKIDVMRQSADEMTALATKFEKKPPF